MIKIEGSEYFDNYEDAFAYYSKLHKVGYSVELCNYGKAFRVSFLGWVKKAPLTGVVR